jgi:hypothetical protein
MRSASTAFDIVLANANVTKNPELAILANLLKTEYLDEGKLDRDAWRGSYTYPNPSFAISSFLRN